MMFLVTMLNAAAAHYNYYHGSPWLSGYCTCAAMWAFMQWVKE